VDDLCELTELFKSGCAHCRNIPDLDAEPATTRRGDGEGPGPIIAARWPGRCVCDQPFAAGDLIRADGEGGWLAGCCAHLTNPDH